MSQLRKRPLGVLVLLLTAIIISSCTTNVPYPFNLDTKSANSYPQASAELAYHHAAELSSACYNGRHPKDAGNVLAAAYISNLFAEIGLSPGGDYGTYFQYFDPYDSSHAQPSPKGVANIIGVLRSPKATQTVIISAHFDHLGRKDDGDIYYGAVDNASGVGVMLELARTIAHSNSTLPFNIEFVAFNCEEDQMLGSSYYMQTRQESPKQILAVLNIDIVGVTNNSTLTIVDGRQQSTLAKALQALAHKLKLEFQWTGNNNRSDHAPFVEAGVPAVTLLHFSQDYFDTYYHTSEDTMSLISLDKLREPALLIIRFIYDLAANYVHPRQSSIHPLTA